MIKFKKSISAVFLALLIHSALADTGPCKLDPAHEIQICGSGNGAAIVIRDTASPSKKIALAWRTPDAPPTEQPDDEKIELLVMRIEDGAILARTKTEYWDTGEMHANRRSETAYWSPDSRLLIHEYSSRFSSDIVELFALDAYDKAAGPLDLLNILNPAVHAKLHARIKDKSEFDFSLTSQKDGEKAAAIDNQGTIRAEVMLWHPKSGPFYYFTVKAKVTRERGKPGVKILSINYRGMEKAQNE